MGNKSGKKKDPTVLIEEEIQMLLANTQYTREQILQWHRGFLKDCPSGQLDKKKFTEVYKEFYPQGKAEKFCAQVFEVFDSDHSGKIDFTEFLIAISVSSHGDVRQKLHLAFQMYDTNKNGKIDKKEMEKIILAIYDLLGETNRKGENDPKLDRDHNGSLSEQEFVEGCINDSVLMGFLAPNA